MKGKMKAAFLREFGKGLSIEETDIPVPGPDEALVQVKASGLCASDLHIIDGILPTVKLNYIPGHEMAGVICKLGENVKGFYVGQHIVTAIDVICGHCRFCRTGQTHLCRSLKRIGFEINGSHEEYAVVPKDNLFPIAESVPFDQAAVIPDAVACMYHAIKDKGQVRAGDRVLILGVGGLGLQGLQIAKYFGAEVYATSRQDHKLEIAKQLGADGVINTAKEDLKDAIVKFTSGEMCDVIFDNIGIKDSIEQALTLLRPGGKIVAVGYSDPEFEANYQEMVIKEKEVIGIRGSSRQNLAETIQLVEKGIVKPYIYQTYPLEKINEALDQLRHGGSLGRTAIVFDEEKKE